MARSSRRRRNTRPSTLLIVMIIVAVLVVVFLGVFRIHTVEVVGASTYSAESIQEDLIDDYWSGNTLIFAWRYHNTVYESKTPYLTSVYAKMVSPVAVQITVEEKTAIGYVTYNGNYVSFDEDGLVLDISNTVNEEAILVTGLTMDEPVLYQKLPVSNSAALRTTLSILRLLRDSETSLSPDSLSFDSNLNITLNFGDVEVELGQDEYLEEKVANLVKIYPQVSSLSGTLNMSAFTGNSEQIAFRASDETEAVTEEETQAEEESQEQTDASQGNTEQTEAVVILDDNDTSSDTSADESDNGETADGGDSTDTLTVGSGVLVFDSSGTLHSDARIVNGEVVDAYGNVIDGCTVTEEGYIRDAYWNIIDPTTGDNLNDSYY